MPHRRRHAEPLFTEFDPGTDGPTPSSGAGSRRGPQPPRWGREKTTPHQSHRTGGVVLATNT